MSIPEDVLETLPPAPYAELRKTLRDGDIVLCQGRDPFSRLIQWSTKSPWSHVGLVFRIDSLDRVIVIEAVEKIGVRAVALSDFVSRDSAGTSPYPGKILFARHRALKGRVQDPKVRGLADFAFGRLGCKFAPGQIARIAARIADARLFGNRRTPRILLSRDEFICSEFVAGAYRQAGLPIPWDGLGFVAPCDIAEDPQVFPLVQADVARPPRDFAPAKAASSPAADRPAAKAPKRKRAASTRRDADAPRASEPRPKARPRQRAGRPVRAPR
jgi:hypothetical protein